MSTDSQSARLAATKAVGSVWWYFLIRSILMFIVGAYMLFKPGLSIIAFTQLIAVLIIIDGFMALVAGFMGEAHSRLWSVLRGVLMIAGGIFIFAQPALVSSIAIKTVLFIIAPFVILSGILEIVASFKNKNKSGEEKGGFFSGLLTTLFGILLIVAPVFYSVVVIQILGVITILMGIPLLYLALKFRKLKKRLASQS